ncbi:MAG: extracellular solute-binding protein [Hyphomicrobiaceae bacterium]|nr:extracellular solute-binding protein [Hyphomicrobiaceae bacterium]
MGLLVRRNGLLIAAAFLTLPWLPAQASASETGTKHTALSLVGTPKHAADFRHFDSVNPDAPKGGRVRLWGTGTFDSLNAYTMKGTPEQRLGLMQATLMARSLDEESAAYGLIAEWVSFPEDFTSATFGLRPEARFSDGTPVRPEDVVFSLEALKAGHPSYAQYFKHATRAEKTGEHEVTFRFDMAGNRELPHIIGELPILSKAYWEGKGANGEPRDVTKSSLEVPVGAGPYRIKELEPGRSITYERIKDWWAKDLPVAKGQWNFDEVSVTYFRDRLPAFEAFKSGQIDYWRESSSKAWATGYDFDAVSKGAVKRDKIPTSGVTPMQAFIFNTRRPQFQDARVRKAFNYAFDFEWANKNLFFDQYVRVGSYFGNSELQAKGLPTGRELEILETVRGEVPPEVFTTEWKNPQNRSEEEARRNLGMASRLLAEAGWTPKGRVLVNAKGEELTAEFLLVQPDFERVVQPFKANLEKLGIKASVRIVDVSQYQRRVDGFDFDIIVDKFSQSISPGNEQRDFWGSQAASHQGSSNTIGIKNPAIDKLIERLVVAKDRAELVAVTRALDRVLLWNTYVVPQWDLPFEWIAYWDKFGRPAKLPLRGATFNQVWWWDSAAAKRLSDTQ